DAVTGFLSDHSAIIKPLAAVLAGMAGGIGLVVGAMRAWAGIQAALNFLMAMNPIGIVVIAIAGLVGGLIYAYKKSETFRNIVNGAFNAVKDVAGKVFGWLPKAAAGAVDFVRNHWKTLVAILAGPLGIAVRLVTANWGKIKGATAAVWNAIKGKLSAAWSAIKGVVSAGVSAAISLIGKWAAIPGKVAGFFGRLKDAVHDKLGDVVGFVKTIPGRVLASLGNLGHLLFNAGASIIQGLIDGVTSKISALVSKLHYLTSLIPKHKGPIAKDRKLLKPAGQAIMDGLIKGLESRESKLKDKLAAITAKIGATKDAMKGVVDTVSGNFMGDAFGGDLTAFDTVLSQNTADASAFNTALQAAVKHGLSGDLLQGLSQSGNLALAQQFAAMSSKDIAAREKAYQARTAAAQGVGQFAANQLYGQQLKAQLSTQQGIRNDLREVLAELRKAQRRKHALAAQHKKSKDDTDTHHKYRTRG
ncbi:MAG TPA: hypothetical protein VGE95_01115, partial [Arthrobacter sp.]